MSAPAWNKSSNQQAAVHIDLAFAKKSFGGNGQVHIRDVSAIDADAAEVMGQHRGVVILEGITTLSDKVAAALGKQISRLCLADVCTLSDNAIESLSKNLGDLELNSLVTISDRAAVALAKHRGTLCLGGVSVLSDAASESLSEHEGAVFLQSLTEIPTKSLAAKLARDTSLLGPCLDGVVSMSPDIADAISACNGGLSLRSLRNISPESVARIVRSNVRSVVVPLETASLFDRVKRQYGRQGFTVYEAYVIGGMKGSREYQRRSFLPTTTPDWLAFVAMCAVLVGLVGAVFAAVSSRRTQSRNGYWDSGEGGAIRDQQEHYDSIIPRGR
jgi:hypothetical protein